MRSASLRAAIAGHQRVGCRGAGMLRMISRKPHSILRSVITLASTVSASATRWFQPSGSRETRPTTITGRSARSSIAAASFTCSGGGRGGRRHVAGGVDGLQRLGQPRLLHLGIEIDVHRAHRRRIGHPVARISASRAAAGEAG